jgi:hypothetical protein
MKISRICVLVLLVVGGSAVAFGDSVTDPTIIIRGANGSSPSGLPVGLNFTFSSPKGGFGNLFFTNVSGKNWTSLTLIENGVPAADITCSTNLFLSCAKKTLENGSVEIILSGIAGSRNPHNGILNGQSFAITFSSWPKTPVDFTAHAGAIPEPGTIALMVTGLGALVSRRKRWKNRLNS